MENTTKTRELPGGGTFTTVTSVLGAVGVYVNKHLEDMAVVILTTGHEMHKAIIDLPVDSGINIRRLRGQRLEVEFGKLIYDEQDRAEVMRILNPNK